MKYCLIGLLCLWQLTYASSLKLSTFNIKWFGLGGDLYGSIEDEYRIPTIKEFWKQHLIDQDVIVFQEIVDTQLFIDEVVPKEFKCLSYHQDWNKHQHVVICYQNKYTLKKELSDDNYLIDAVSLLKYRPAIWGILADQQGNNLLHLVGVHLKADGHSTPTRILQVQHIATAIEQFEDNLPIVILGDFNTHAAPYNGQSEDDTTLFSQILSPLGLAWVENKFTTYVTKWSRRTFDHFWISSDLKVIENLSIFQACQQNDNISTQDYFSNLSIYNHEISDHCPLSIGIELDGH